MSSSSSPVEASWSTPDDLHQDLVTLTRWLAAGPSSVEDVLERVEKPWHFLDELAAAKAGVDPSDFARDA